MQLLLQKKISHFLFFSLLTIASLPIQAGMEVLDQFYANTKSFSADFEQRVAKFQGQTLERSNGSLIIKRPNQFVLSYKDPDEQYYISNGKVLWIYDVELEQVTIKAFDASMARSPALLLASGKNIHQAYTVIEVKEDNQPNRHIFRLTPKLIAKNAEDADIENETFKEIYLIFENKHLVELTMQDNFDQITTLKLNKVKLNPQIAKERFEFKIPENVDVIGSLIPGE